MTTYTTAAEAAKIIRSALKAKRGWGPRDVSVRSDQYSGGSSIDVRVKIADIPLSVVREIAEGQERIHRCDYSGEILSGGNRFVHVRYSDAALDVLGERYEPQVVAAINALPEGEDSRLMPVLDDPKILIGRRMGRYAIYWPEGSPHYCTEHWSASDAAKAVGIFMVDQEARP